MPELKNTKHEIFCALYVDYPNATEAYFRACGNTIKRRSAQVMGFRLLKKDDINQRISELRRERMEMLNPHVLADKLSAILEFDITEILTDSGELDMTRIKELPRAQRLVIEGLKKHSTNGESQSSEKLEIQKPSFLSALKMGLELYEKLEERVKKDIPEIPQGYSLEDLKPQMITVNSSSALKELANKEQGEIEEDSNDN